MSVNQSSNSYLQTDVLDNSPERIDFRTKKVLVFWIRFNDNNIGSTLDAWVYFRTYSGSTIQATRAYRFINNGQFYPSSGRTFSTATVGNDWVRIVVDLSDLGGYNPSTDGTTLAFFGLMFNRGADAVGSYYAYIDDIGVYDGL